ncbi:MAG: hypothetical protein GWP03_02105 [Proteobacteria bacterium]|nr:hypothetical protein [Pseudomonadota bacterium]
MKRKVSIILLFFLVFATIYGDSTKKVIAYILKVRGNVTVQKGGNWDKVASGYKVINGDVIKVGKKGLAVVKFIDKGDIVAIKENSTIKIQGKIKNGRIAKRLFLKVGDIVASVKKGKEGEFSITTPVATASIKGTEFGMKFVNDSLSLMMCKGVVVLFNNQGSVFVHKGESAVCVKGQMPIVRKGGVVKDNKLEIEFLDARNVKRKIIIDYESK